MITITTIAPVPQQHQLTFDDMKNNVGKAFVGVIGGSYKGVFLISYDIVVYLADPRCTWTFSCLPYVEYWVDLSIKATITKEVIK